MGTVKRRYDNARRQAQAAATRRDVLEAAGDLFASRGYAASSVDAIATAAGVSRETIFKTFGTKRQLLQRWVEHRVAGDDEPVPIAQQRWVEAIRGTSDHGRQAETVAAALSAMYDRAIDALLALRAAAHTDADIAEVWALACERRRHDVTMVTAMLVTDPTSPVTDGPGDRLVDLVYSYTSPEMFELLVRQCGWSPEQYQDWLTAVLQGLLSDSPPRPP